MCGLVGVSSANNLTGGLFSAFTQLLIIDTLRGFHSTGVMRISTSGDVNVHKAAIDGMHFVDGRKYDREINLPFSTRIVAGHNRAATRGKVNYENSHPFTHGDVTLMHNGTLRSVINLDNYSEFDTDSEAIAYNLSKVSPEDAGEVISKLNGAFALVWYDQRDSSLNFIRNAERPLYVVGDALVNPEVLMWASEKDMISLVNNRQVKPVDFVGDIMLLKLMRHYKVTHDSVSKTFKVDDSRVYEEYKRPQSQVVTRFDRTSANQHPRLPPQTTTPATGAHTPPKHYPKVGEVIDVLPETFTKYSSANYGLGEGCVRGCTDAVDRFGDVKLLPIRIHNKTQKDFDAWTANGSILSCKVVHISYDTTNKEHLIIASCLEERTVTQKPASNDFATEDVRLHVRSSLERDNRYDLAYTHEVEPYGLKDVIEFIPGYRKRLLTYGQFEKLTQHGCLGCGEDLFLADADDIFWESEDSPLCSSCQKLVLAGSL